MTNADPREPKLVVTDSIGFRLEWGGDGQCFTDEEIQTKLAYMRDAARELGIVADVTLHIKAPQPLSISQRAMLLCELWFECEGCPTEEQWNNVLEDMWAASCHAARERGEPKPDKPPFPARPMRAVKGAVSHLQPVEEGDK